MRVQKRQTVPPPPSRWGNSATKNATEMEEGLRYEWRALLQRGYEQGWVLVEKAAWGFCGKVTNLKADRHTAYEVREAEEVRGGNEMWDGRKC